jgi:hypothetical protein
MSLSNIVNIELEPAPFEGIVSVIVTFKTHAGDLRAYRYQGYAATAILAGDDPADYFGSPA